MLPIISLEVGIGNICYFELLIIKFLFMKKLRKLSLHGLENRLLSNQSLKHLKGGCGCGCYYANSGGSSTGWNDASNYEGGLSSGGGAESCGCAGGTGANDSEFWQ